MVGYTHTNTRNLRCPECLVSTVGVCFAHSKELTDVTATNFILNPPSLKECKEDVIMVARELNALKWWQRKKDKLARLRRAIDQLDYVLENP